MDELAASAAGRVQAPSFDDAWREHRTYLLSIAFRMLGNIADAEDVVQDAFTRLMRLDRAEINDVRGWLVVVVSRLCLDHLGSARSRRETQKPHEHPAFAAHAAGVDPADRVTLDDSVRTALLVVLSQLSPAERTVFVLHEVFSYPFEAVAEIVGRSPTACRQLASRARRRVEAGGASRFVVEPLVERHIADEFVAACAGADVDKLMRLLDPDVVGQADLGDRGKTPPLQGRELVARNLLRFFGPGITLVTQPVDGHAGVLAFRGRDLAGVVSFTLKDGLIDDIHAVVDPQAYFG